MGHLRKQSPYAYQAPGRGAPAPGRPKSGAILSLQRMDLQGAPAPVERSRTPLQCGDPRGGPGSLPAVEPSLHPLGPTVAATLPPFPSLPHHCSGVPDCTPVTTPTRRHLFAGSAGRNVPDAYRDPHPHSTGSETELGSHSGVPEPVTSKDVGKNRPACLPAPVPAAGDTAHTAGLLASCVTSSLQPLQDRLARSSKGTGVRPLGQATCGWAGYKIRTSQLPTEGTGLRLLHHSI